MIWCIPLTEIDRFNKTKTMSTQISACWETLLKSMPKNLQVEVKEKGLNKIELHPINKLLISDKHKVMKFDIPNASKELEEILSDNENTILSQ